MGKERDPHERDPLSPGRREWGTEKRLTPTFWSHPHGDYQYGCVFNAWVAGWAWTCLGWEEELLGDVRPEEGRGF